MQDDKRPLLNELCYNLYQRNQIELRRRSAKNKIYYYEQIKKTVQAYKGTNSRILSLTREIKMLERRQGMMGGNADIPLAEKRLALAVEKKSMTTIVAMKSKPLKWLDNLQGLNNLILKHRAAYMKARYDTSKLTCTTRKRIHRICSLLDATIDYQFGTGFVKRITFKNMEQIEHHQFEVAYREVEANKAIDKVLRSKNEQ